MPEFSSSRVGSYRDKGIAQAAAVQNTWYTVATLSNVELRLIYFKISVANETLTVRLTVDGNTYQCLDFGATFNTDYYVSNNGSLVGQDSFWAVSDGSNIVGILGLQGKSVKVEIRKTTAAGAGTLTCIVKYTQY